VRDEGGGWTRWTVASATGPEIVFDAVATATIPNHLIAWKTAPRQPLRQSGLVRFEELSPGVTQVDVQMTYTPPAGQLADSVTSLFRSDAASALDDDLLRLKSIIETQGGATPQGGEATPARERSDRDDSPRPEEKVPFVDEPRAAASAGSEVWTPVPREESLMERPEEAIVAAQDAGVVPLIQEKPGQAEPVHPDVAAATTEGSEPEVPGEKPARRKSRKKRPGPSPTDQIDF